MQRAPKQLVPTQLVTGVAAVYYTAPAATVADISAATVTNVTAGAQSVTVYLTGGAAAASNTIVQTRSVPANSSVQLWELIGQKVSPGVTIKAMASLAATLTLSIGGYEITQ